MHEDERGNRRGNALRRLAVPLLVLAAALYLPRVAGPDSDSGSSPLAVAPIDDPFGLGANAAQVDVLDAIWQAWDGDVSSTSSDAPADQLPPELTSVSSSEAIYVLLSVRAAQVAAAAALSPDVADLATAVSRAGLAPDPPGITVQRLRGGGRECIALSYVDEPFGRAFFGLLEPFPEPGPEPLSALEAVLLDRVRVGPLNTDARLCGGGGVAYSPFAQEAVAVLAADLLSP